MKQKALVILLLLMSVVALMAQTVSSTDTVTVHSMRGTYDSDRFVGRKTSNGEVFSQNKYTAAHCSYKFGTLLLVTNPKNGKQVIVRVNDRCPRRNVVDMSRKAARQIGVGSLNVKVQVLPPRFYPFWESQESFLDVMSEGKFLHFAATKLGAEWLLHNAQSPSSKVDEADTAGRENSRWEELSRSMQGIDYQLYDIELFRCTTRTVAQKRVNQLPFYYRDYVEYAIASGENRVVVRLSVSYKKDRAERLLEEFKDAFPDAILVKTK